MQEIRRRSGYTSGNMLTVDRVIYRGIRNSNARSTRFFRTPRTHNDIVNYVRQLRVIIRHECLDPAIVLVGPRREKAVAFAGVTISNTEIRNSIFAIPRPFARRYCVSSHNV